MAKFQQIHEKFRILAERYYPYFEYKREISPESIYRIRITLFKHIHMTYVYKATSTPPSFISIRHYFFNVDKPAQLRDRREIFAIIDDIARTLDVYYTTIPTDQHEYKKCGEKIRSRYIDLFHREDRRSFYQRGWQDAFILNSDEIQMIPANMMQLINQYNDIRTNIINTCRELQARILVECRVWTEHQFYRFSEYIDRSIYDYMNFLTTEIREDRCDIEMLNQVKSFYINIMRNNTMLMLKTLIEKFIQADTIVKIYKTWQRVSPPQSSSKKRKY